MSLIIKISVIMFTGKTITLRLNRCLAIARFKARIHALEGLCPDQQRLTFAGKHLDDDAKTLADHGIQDGSTLHLLRIIRSSVKMRTRETIAIEVECSSSVDKVRAKIIGEDGSTWADYSFEKNRSEKYVWSVHEGPRLLRMTVEENTVAVEAGNNQKDRTTNYRTVLRLRGHGMQIFVRLMCGKTFSLDVESNDSIADVKAKIEEVIHASLLDHKLIHDGRALRECQTVADCNIQNESTLDVVLHVTGGGCTTYTEARKRMKVEETEETWSGGGPASEL